MYEFRVSRNKVNVLKPSRTKQFHTLKCTGKFAKRKNKHKRGNPREKKQCNVLTSGSHQLPEASTHPRYLARRPHAENWTRLSRARNEIRNPFLNLDPYKGPHLMETRN